MRKIHNLQLCLLLAAFMTASLGIPPELHGQSKKPKRGVQDVSTPAVAGLPPGGYVALVIGNNNYRYVGKLKTAVNDANAVAQVLRDRYGFATTVLLDATRNSILTALNQYR